MAATGVGRTALRTETQEETKATKTGMTGVKGNNLPKDQDLSTNLLLRYPLEIKEKSRLDLRLSFLYHNHSQNNPLRFLIKELAKEEVIKVVTEETVAVKAARKETTVIKRGIKEGTKVAKEGINGTKGEVIRGLSRKAILAASASSLPAHAAPSVGQRISEDADDTMEEGGPAEETSGEPAIEELTVNEDGLVVFPTITETIWDTGTTETTTTTFVEEQETITEDTNNLITSTLCDPSPNRLNLYLANISSSIPRPQTICANEVDITTAEYYQGQEQTALRVSYVTVTAERSVWIGRTLSTTYTDYHAMTQCWQGGGWYGHP
ncbi:hypothetical protein VUR80DRAFT_4524 [Thermomyces stellatus]